MSRKHSAKASQLNRNHHQRQALFKTQLTSLITHGEVTTTLTKAKILARLFDKLTALAKRGTIASRRLVSARISNQISGNKLVDVIAPLMSDRPSGFTTLIKHNVRKGDAVQVATVKLIKSLPIATPKVEKTTKPVTTNKIKKS